MISLRARRLLAALLAAAGLVALLAGAARHEIPYADSVAMARRFWRAGPRARLLNAPGFARDAAFVADAERMAAAWPPDVDALLAVGPLVPPEVRERLRRKAAYVLSPRRVRLVPGSAGAIALRPAPPEGADR